MRNKFINLTIEIMDYRYYVYVRPGYIEYFDDLEEALTFARQYDAEVKEC